MDKTIFEVMLDADCATDPEQRAKDLRHAVAAYNYEHNTKHVLDRVLINLYWTFLESNNLLSVPWNN